MNDNPHHTTEMAQNTNEHHTTDLVLAAYLRLNGCVLKQILKQGSKGTFVFVGNIDDLVQLYDLGSAQVEPVAFNNAIKSLTTAVRRMS